MERGVTFLQGYGLSEAAPFVLLLDPTNALRKVGSAGKPPLFVDVRTVRPDGTACDADETGELLVQRPERDGRLLEPPDETRRGDRRPTGGSARATRRGSTTRGSSGSSIASTTRTRSPAGSCTRATSSACSRSIPAVADAGVAPHDGAGRGFVVLAAGEAVSEDELLELCRVRLAAHEVPSSITFVDRLPRSSVGKLLRHELASLAASDVTD